MTDTTKLLALARAAGLRKAVTEAGMRVVS